MVEIKLNSEFIADWSISDSTLRLYLYLIYFNKLHGFCGLTDVDLGRILNKDCKIISELIEDLLGLTSINVEYVDGNRRIYIM